MSDTRSITTLPTELLDALEARVAEGEFANESAAVQAALEAYDVSVTVSDEWLIREVLPVLDRGERDPTRWRTSEQVAARMEELHRNALRADGRAA